MSADLLMKITEKTKKLRNKKDVKRETRKIIRREKIRQARLQHAEAKSKEIKTRILTTLATNEKSTFTQLLNATGYSRQTLSKYLTKLKEEGLLLKTFHKNKTIYSLRKVTPDIQFIPITIQFLIQELKINGINSFNHKLGSLITFLIYKNKTHLLNPLLNSLHFRIKLEENKLAEKILAETKEWEIWKDALEGCYTEEKEFSEDGLTYKRELITPTVFVKKWLKREEQQ